MSLTSLQDSLNQDDLTAIDGVGPTRAESLRDQGIESAAQLVALSPDELLELDNVGEWTVDQIISDERYELQSISKYTE